MRQSLMNDAKLTISGLKDWCRNQPFVFATLAPLRERYPYRRRVVRVGDDVVIEGFPRSANTYATEAFLRLQERDIRIGNHFHSPAQFLLASKFKVPAILVLRYPDDAILSLLIFYPKSSATELANRYISFHRPLLSIRSDFVVAPFEEVTQSFSRSISRLNVRFGTNFVDTEIDEDLRKDIFDRVNAKQAKIDNYEKSDSENLTTLPSDLKNRLKKRREAELNDPLVQERLSECRRLYNSLISGSRVPSVTMYG